MLLQWTQVNDQPIFVSTLCAALAAMPRIRGINLGLGHAQSLGTQNAIAPVNKKR